MNGDTIDLVLGDEFPVSLQHLLHIAQKHVLQHEIPARHLIASEGRAYQGPDSGPHQCLIFQKAVNVVHGDGPERAGDIVPDILPGHLESRVKSLPSRVEGQHRIVKYISHHSAVERFGHLRLRREFLHGRVIELRLAGEPGLEGRGGIMHCPDSLKVLFRLRYVRFGFRDAYVLPHHLPDHVLIAILIFKLLYVAALLPRLESLCPRIVEEPDLPGPLDHPEEVI